MNCTDSKSGVALGTLHELLISRCRGYAESEALVSSADAERAYSHGEIASLCVKIAHGLHQGGVKKGTRVGLLSENCPEWGIIYLAILAAGGIVVPLDPALKEKELSRLFVMSRIEYLFVPDDNIDGISKILAENGRRVFLIGIFDSIDGAKSIIETGNDYIETEIDPHDTAALIYTSGTTGDPKGVILTHRNLIANLEQIYETLPIVRETVFLSVLPVHHTFEATVGLLFPLYNGSKVIYVKAMNSKAIIEDIRDYGITMMVGVPLLYEKMFKSILKKISDLPFVKRNLIAILYGISKLGWKLGRNWGKGLFRGLRTRAGMETMSLFVCGGGPLLPEITEYFNMLGFSFVEGYGLTECAPVVSVNLEEDNRFGSVGPPLPGVELDIYEPNDDEIGEILVKGDNCSPGYIDNPEATSALREGEWLHTGDLGRIEDRYLYIMGRAKNLIITAAGKNVYPEEIEEHLHKSDYISEAIVIGRKKEGRMGEGIHAIIYPDIERLIADEMVDPVNPKPESIRKAINHVINEVNGELSAYKRISKFDITLKELQKTTTRKIKRNVYK